MRKLLLALPILAGVAALSAPAQAAPVAQLVRPDGLALNLVIPDTATETVQYYREDRREWRRARERARRAEMRRRAEGRYRRGYYR